jgi:PAS domain S-box-containing protein
MRPDDASDSLLADADPAVRAVPQRAAQRLWQEVARPYALASAVTTLLTVATAVPGLPQAARAALLGMWGGVLLVSLLVWRTPARIVVHGAVVLAALWVLALGATSVLLSLQAGAALLGFMALHAALAAALGGMAGSVVVGAAALAAIAARALFAQPSTAVVSGQIAPWLPSLVALALIAIALACGGVVRWAVERFADAADERQRRFRGLLEIAADAYWELDAALRLQQADTESAGRTRAVMLEPSMIGQLPWELPAFVCDPEVLDQLQADLGARQRLRDVPVGWRGARGTLRHLLVSGEPRYDARGVFRGYWGVARDITEDLRARRALALTEARYQDLFVSTPTPLVLHRDGRIAEANPAAATLFGWHDAAAMIGSDLLAMFDDGDARERVRRRIERLQTMPPGEALPVAEYELNGHNGRRLSVRSTGVAVATERGPAVLSIFVDDTDRQRAEQAVRRSEALLSHLVASSPDLITLSDLASGRYAMVNQAYERITGWSADEVVGRTSMEIGQWKDPADREHLANEVRKHGRVQDMPLRLVDRHGREIPILVSGARFTMDRREYLVVNARDMSAAERERLEREAILDNASVGIAMTREERFQWVNPTLETMLGAASGSLVGEPVTIVMPDDDAVAAMRARIEPLLQRGEAAEAEFELCRRDGSRFTGRVQARAVDRAHPSRGGTIWILEDITERKRADEALARARDAAEAANRAKSAFLANTSHELRTPLNGLIGLAQLARNPATPEERRRQYLDQIVDSAQSLGLIVSDILDLSKIEAGRLSVESEPFDLSALLRNVHRSHAALAAGRALALSLEIDPELGWVRGDALRVRQILVNYLGNALKFTHEGRVRLVGRRDGADAVLLEVHDTGPGVAQELQGRLFEPFSQADQSTTRRYGGTGLGLSICRQLAELMGGEVGLRSEPGAGSCFWARIPLPAVDAEPTAPAPLAAGPEAGIADDADFAGLRVLVVDDNEVNNLVATAQLEQLKLRVTCATDGRLALDAVAAAEAAGDPFQLVLMDLQMPGLSGFEAVRALRLRHDAAHLPVIAHTAAAMVSERDAALAAGMNDFLPKPTEPDRLRRMVARWARVQRAAVRAGS